MKKAILVVGLVLIMGCASSTSNVGRDFTMPEEGQLIKGQSTKGGVVALLGEPWDKTLIEAGRERWTYYFMTTSVKAQSTVISVKATGETVTKKLEVLFSGDVVDDYVYSENTSPISYGP